ncbi:MAG: serine hydrolase domain-containing protein [Acetobacteraceae bacterium]
MTTDTIFNIASMTKPMTTVAALSLQEQGKLLIDDPVSKYVPGFTDMKVAMQNPGGTAITGTVAADRPLTIRDLMTHTSGLIYGGRGATAVHKLYPPGSGGAAQLMNGQEFLAKLSSLPLLYQPGTVWDYGFGLDITGLIVEALTKESLGDYLESQVFKPLGMVDTGFLIPTDKVSRYAHALPTDPATGQPQTVDPDATHATKFECGGGCAVSTAGDYMRFATMLLNHGVFDGQRILGRKTVEYMTANQLGPHVRNLIGNADPHADRLRVRPRARRPDHAGDRPFPGLGRHVHLARRQRDELVGRSPRTSRRRLHGAYAGPGAVALPGTDRCAGVSGYRRLGRS